MDGKDPCYRIIDETESLPGSIADRKVLFLLKKILIRLTQRDRCSIKKRTKCTNTYGTLSTGEIRNCSITEAAEQRISESRYPHMRNKTQKKESGMCRR